MLTDQLTRTRAIAGGVIITFYIIVIGRVLRNLAVSSLGKSRIPRFVRQSPSEKGDKGKASPESRAEGEQVGAIVHIQAL